MKRLRQVERSESLSERDEGKLCLWRGGDHYFTVVFRKIMYYRWVVSGRKMKNGMKSCSLLRANSCKL